MVKAIVRFNLFLLTKKRKQVDLVVYLLQVFRIFKEDLGMLTKWQWIWQKLHASKWSYEYKVIVYHNVIKGNKSASDTDWHHYNYQLFFKCFPKTNYMQYFPESGCCKPLGDHNVSGLLQLAWKGFPFHMSV